MAFPDDLLLMDDFNRANGDAGHHWHACATFGKMPISGNALFADGYANNAILWTGRAMSADCALSITLTQRTTQPNNIVYMHLRCSTYNTMWQGLVAGVDDSETVIGSWLTGHWSTLAINGSHGHGPAQVGDQYGFEAIGNLLSVYWRRPPGSWALDLQTTYGLVGDPGYGGLFAYENAKLDDFYAWNFPRGLLVGTESDHAITASSTPTPYWMPSLGVQSAVATVLGPTAGQAQLRMWHLRPRSFVWRCHDVEHP